MGMRRADEIAEQHTGQVDVVDVIALALCEAGILHAPPRMAEALELAAALLAAFGGHIVHCAASLAAFISAAAARMARTMFWYPVHLQRLPAMPKRTSSSVGFAFSCSRRCARVIIPGVQKPHCSP